MTGSHGPSGVFEYGPDDRVFDSFLVTGGTVLLLIGLLGRGTFTVLLGAGYVGFFFTYVLVKGSR